MDLPQLTENFLQALTAGLLTGAIYGLVCVGLSLIFGVMRVINFAHGDFMMLGMYAAFYAFGALSATPMFGEWLAPYVGALLAGPAVFLAGLLVHKLLVSRVTGMRAGALASEGHYAQLILTLGIALVLQNGALWLFGSAPVSIQTPLASRKTSFSSGKRAQTPPATVEATVFIMSRGFATAWLKKMLSTPIASSASSIGIASRAPTRSRRSPRQAPGRSAAW